MPFIQTSTNVKITPEQENALKSQMGKAVELIGKSEGWLMLEFRDNCRLCFQGDSQAPAAICEVKLYGKASPAAYDKLTGALTGLVGGQLGIGPGRIYVKYEEVAHWGYNGSNF